MSATQNIGPLEASVEDTEVVLRFCDPMEMALEVPPFLSEELRTFVADHQEVLASRPLVLDLGSTPAINSRQLGVILTVRDVVAGGGRLVLRGASDSVRRLLTITKMEQFFDLR